MLRLCMRTAGRFAIVALATLTLCACGTKGPLVPAKKSADTAAPAPAAPPAATTTPEIPSATLPSTTQPAP
jgi:predicted small lipoprotein YifL